MTAAHQRDVDIQIFSYGTLQQAEVQLKDNFIYFRTAAGWLCAEFSSL